MLDQFSCDLKGFAHAADLQNFRILGFDPFSTFLDQKRGFWGLGLSRMDPDRNLAPYPSIHAPNVILRALAQGSGLTHGAHTCLLRPLLGPDKLGLKLLITVSADLTFLDGLQQ